MLNKLAKAMLIFLIVVHSVVLVSDGDAHAKLQNHTQKEDVAEGTQYIPAEKAIKQFEREQGRKVNLPKKMPFRPTHKFGQLTKDGDLRLHYLRVLNKPHQDFLFSIMSPENKIEKHISPEDKIVTLKDGTKAYFHQSEEGHTLAFAKKGWGYLLSGSTKSSKNYHLEQLIEMAESI
ncbi:hypothetical protein JCM9140_1181 [Halalkalibacter wakoensis JCM 9140]|uniref:DUF4367 domain-containing protein n=1 Tax=Halalkalibacter wakoensis JCM 9140 TaxID=1236970 RepID=W4PZD4_9BACI|nr:hypothetical protein [Halalkalibacter wakoensis]GAE25201.1 hypothetical protein JCM9140_1181 [Halalkalibacter wakoensis JCM 9140]